MDWNLATSWESVADARPDATALVHGDARRSYAELDERAARLAAALAAHGVGPGAKVGAFLRNSSEYVETLFATFKLRAVPVNVNYRYLADELVYLLRDSDAEALVFHASLAECVAAAREQVPAVRAWIEVDDGSPPSGWAPRYEDLLAAHEPAPRIERSEDDLYFLYTGGTTGLPKGVMWRSGDLWRTIAGGAYPLAGQTVPETVDAVGATARALHDAGQRIVHLPASPLMHGTGALTTFQTLLLGGTVVTLESRHFDPDELWRAVEREGVTQMAIVGDAFARPMLDALEAAVARGEPYDASSLRLVISSGVMWTAEVKEGLQRHAAFVAVDSLGSSEGIGFATSMSFPGAAATTARFVLGADAKVLRDDGTEVEAGSGEVGMLAVAGAIPVGYYKDEAKSAATFREIGGRRWSIPGDYARVEADGTVVLLGRGSVCINTGGEKVFPEEVEEAVKRHPAVADCVVVGVPDARFGQAVAAVVARRAGMQAGEDEIAGSLDGLARYKHPRRYVFVDEVLRGPNGKADYRWATATAAAPQ